MEAKRQSLSRMNQMEMAGSSVSPIKQVARRQPMIILLLTTVLVVALVAHQAKALSLSYGPRELDQYPEAYNDFVANLVDEYLVNSDRLKKSRGPKAVKTTLRFGRRSDPSWNPEWLAQQLAVEDHQLPTVGGSNRQTLTDK